MTVGFTNLVLKLGSRVRFLDEEGAGLSPGELEEGLGVCGAWLRQLEARATEQSIDLIPYYQPMVDIRTRLGRLRSMLARRNQPWWKRLLFKVAKFANLFIGLFGISPLLPEAGGAAGFLER